MAIIELVIHIILIISTVTNFQAQPKEL